MGYVVLWWDGDEMKGTWKKSRTVELRPEASKLSQEYKAVGKPTIILPTANLKAIGLPLYAPTWWDFDKACRKETAYE